MAVTLSGYVELIFIHKKRRILASFDFNMTETRARHTKVWIICEVPSKIGDMPGTIGATKDNIREAIGEIQLKTMNKVIKNYIEWVRYCTVSQGSRFNDIIFHY